MQGSRTGLDAPGSTESATPLLTSPYPSQCAYAHQAEDAGFGYVGGGEGNQLHPVIVAMIGADLERINAIRRGTASFAEQLKVARVKRGGAGQGVFRVVLPPRLAVGAGGGLADQLLPEVQRG